MWTERRAGILNPNSANPFAAAGLQPFVVMSGFEQEQAEEIEVLQSIFPTELEIISSNPSAIKVHLTPTSSPDENHVAVALLCTFPRDYPSCLPTLEIEVEKGLGKKHVDELKCLIEASAAENVGMPSVFAITEVIKTWLIDNNIPGQDGSMYAEMMRRMQQKDVDSKKKAEKAQLIEAADSENKTAVEDPDELERIRKRQAGTVVTLETFNAWKLKFDAEMKEVALAAAGGKVESLKDPLEERLTGKQLFMQNRAGLGEDLIAAGEQEDLSLIDSEGGDETPLFKSSGIDEEDLDDVLEDSEIVDDDCRGENEVNGDVETAQDQVDDGSKKIGVR